MEEWSKLRMGSVNQCSREQRSGKLGINFWLYCYLAVNVCLELFLSFAKLGIIANLVCCRRRELQNWII